VGDRKKKATARKEKPAAGMGRAEVREFRQLLARRRTELKQEVDRMGGDALTRGSGELSTMPLHMADVGSDTFEQDMTLGRLESGSEELAEIQAALDRIERGSYGLCENCQKPIPKTRLRAIPYAKLCIACKQKEEAVS
jgi:RNA polymerase-binding protein DksA